MPDRLADQHPETPTGTAAGHLAWLAGAACVSCCAVPALVAAGVLGSAAAGVAAWLPTAAVVLAVAAVVVLAAGHVRARRRRPADGCAPGACACAGPTDVPLSDGGSKHAQ